jgi:hypothetical protein
VSLVLLDVLTARSVRAHRRGTLRWRGRTLQTRPLQTRTLQTRAAAATMAG